MQHKLLHDTGREIKFKKGIWWIRFILCMIDERGDLICHRTNLQDELREPYVALKVLENVTLALAT